jgi:hypothetical protein
VGEDAANHRGGASSSKAGDSPCWLTRLVLSDLPGPQILSLRCCSIFFSESILQPPAL